MNNKTNIINENNNHEQLLANQRDEFEEMYRNIFNETKGMITIIDAETCKIVYANDNAIKAFGKDNYIGNICYKCIHHRDHVCDNCLLNSNLDCTDTEDVKYGERYYRLFKKKIKWNGKDALLEYSEDVSEIYQIKSFKNELDLDKKKEEILLKSIPGGVALYHIMDTGLIKASYISEGLVNLVGYTPHEFLEKYGEDTKSCVYEEDREIIGEAIKKLLNDNIPISNRFRLYAKNGDLVSVHFDGNTIDLGEKMPGEIATLYAVQTLITDESVKKIEREEALINTVNSVPAGIGIFEVKDHDLFLVYMNDAYYKMVGINRESIEKNNSLKYQDFIYPKDTLLIKKAIEKLYKGDNTENFDFRVKSKDGSIQWLHAECSVTKRSDNYLRLCAAFYDISELKIHQLSLLASRRATELVQIYGDLNIWTYNIDKKTIIQQVNNVEKGYMGYEVFIENVPKCFIEEGDIYPDDVEAYINIYKKLEEGIERADLTYRLKNHETDKYNWIRMIYQRMESNENNERLAVGFSIKVDKEQEAIEHYNVEKQLRDTIYKDAILYIEYNLTKDCYEVNYSSLYQTENWSNISQEDYFDKVKKKVDSAFVSTLTEKLYSKNLLKAFNAGESKVSYEYRNASKDSRSERWNRTTAIMVKKPDSQDVMAFIYVQDIDDQKKTQLALETSISENIESIFLINVKNNSGKIIKWDNKIFTNDLKDGFIYSDNFVRRTFQKIVEDDKNFDYSLVFISKIIEELDNNDNYQLSITNIINGEKRRRLLKYRYLDDRKQDIVLSVSDITTVYLEEVKKKNALADALLETKKASSAKADFYSRMSHDLRTPMNGILGMAQLSENENDINVLKENMKKIYESGEYLLNLINDTLDVQRIESSKLKIKPTIIRTDAIVNSIVDMVKNNAENKGVNLIVDTGNTDLNWYIKVDEIRLKQIFVNLLSNAVKFTPSGGEVVFEFKLLERVGMISHDVVYVRDTGIGMSEEFLKNEIFKPFSQERNEVSATYAGSGLGLSIAKSLVELMGGHIEVESELGVGTTFAVYLDFIRVSEIEAKDYIDTQKTEKSKNIAELKGKNILLVEDHPLNAEIALKLLERAGCSVKWLDNGKKVVDLMKTNPQKFDIILMDIRMPIMDGLEATSQIRQLPNCDKDQLPIIAMTANAYEEDIRKCLEVGMNDHLSKPIRSADLYETIIKNI